jgi:hypothetical protein
MRERFAEYASLPESERPEIHYSYRGPAPEFHPKKRCLGCGHQVPLTSEVGQRCPHCGGIWGEEIEGEQRFW